MPIVQLKPSKAAYVDSGFPTTTSNNSIANPGWTGIGDEANAVANIWIGYDTYFNAGTLNTWLTFNLTEIPAGSTITNVWLRFNVDASVSCDYADSTFSIHKLADGVSFSTSSLTWNNAPNANLAGSSTATWIDPFDETGASGNDEWANELNPWIITMSTTDVSASLDHSSKELSYRISNDGNAVWSIPRTSYDLVVQYDENSSTAAKLYYDGELSTYDTVDERLPAVLDGLMYHYPLDNTDQSTGTWNKNGNYATRGTPSIQDIAHSFVELVPQSTIIKFTGWFKKSVDFVNNVGYFHYYQRNGGWVYQNSGYFQSSIGTDWTYITGSITVQSTTGTITNGRQGVTVRNGSNVGTIEWRDCEVHFPPHTNTNPQHSTYGLSMFDVSTNLVDFAGYADNDVIVTDDVLKPYLSGNEVKKIEVDNTTNPYIAWTLGSSTTSGLKYAASIKVLDPHDVVSNVYFNNSISNYTGMTSGSFAEKNGWKTYWAAGTSSYTGTGTSLGVFANGSSVGDTYWVSEPMVEQKALPTAFTTASRSLGVFATTGSDMMDQGTIAFKHRVTTPTISFPTIMNMGWYTNPITRDGIAFYRGQGWDNANSIYCAMWCTASQNQPFNAAIVTATADSLENHDLYYAISYKTGSGTGTVSVRLKDLTTNTMLYTADQTGKTYTWTHFSPIYFGSLDGGSHQQGWYRDISVYNRALTPDELDKLVSSPLQIHETLTVVDEEVKEEMYLPTGSYYFPLMYESSSIYSDVLPSECTEEVYERNRGIFVGQYTQNLLDTGYRDLSSSTDLSSASTKTLVDTGKYRWVNDGSNLSTIRSYCLLASLSSGTPYNCNIKFEDLRGGIQMDWCDVSTNLTGSYTADSSTDSGTMYGKLAMTSARSTYDATYRFMDIRLNPGTSVTLFEPQVQIQQFETPYTSTTRNISSLEFNLSGSIGMDWNGEWTISYWKYPTGTHLSNGLNGYSIESLGCNANSIGGGYTWWGKNSGTNVLASFTPSAFDPDDYFRRWQMVTLVKNGTIITYRIRGINGIENAVRTVNIGTVASNYYATQYGYDLKLGGWDNGNSNNAYFRDLVVAKRAFTDSEQDNMYNQMKVRFGDGTYVKILTEEGV